MKKLIYNMCAGTLLAVVVIVAAIAWTPSVSAVSYGSCQEVPLSVAMGPGQSANQTISGTLCTPHNWAEGERQVDVLVHGATYNRAYWDWPVQNAFYSYVSDTLLAGRATFAYDRIGAGDSSQPFGALATLEADAHILHQIVQWLRSTHNYPQVNAIGHSLGSSVIIQEAATHKDVDRVVLTGVLHTPNIGALFNAISFHPAMIDPAFAGLLDPTYLTTVPGTRGNLFYSSYADASVIAHDEAHKDKTPATQIVGSALVLETPAILNVARHITAPVLVVVGAEDALLCNGPLATVDCSSATAIATNETPYFANATSLSAFSIPATGHNLTLHPSAQNSFNAINGWLQTH